MKETTLPTRILPTNDVEKPKEPAINVTPMEQGTERLAGFKQQKHAILGIGLLLVIVSITFSTYVTVMFVRPDVYFALAPQIIFALYILLRAFSKIYK